MLNKSYDWASTFLWIGIYVTVVILGWRILYAPDWYLLTCVSILFVLLMILGYIQYTKVLSLKRKFIIVQETFTTAMLVYFALYYFSEERKMPTHSVLKKIHKKIDNIYETTRYHLTVPLVMTAVKTFTEIKNIKNNVKNDMKYFSSSDGFNIENAQRIATELANLLQKIKRLIEILAQGLSSKNTVDDSVKCEVREIKAKIKKTKKIIKNTDTQKTKRYKQKSSDIV